MYQNALEEILYALDEEHEEAATLKTQSNLEEDEFSWPPWPWPPWGDDDDGNSPENRTERAQRLAKEVIKFERRIANASLDL